MQLYFLLPIAITTKIWAFWTRYLGNDGRAELFNNVFNYVKAQNIEGDYLEFGVCRGTSIVHACSSISKYDLKIRVFAIDSFKGLPESELNVFLKGEFTASCDHFQKFIKCSGANVEKVYSIEGFYEDTLNTETIKKYELELASVIHIDCDLYVSTRKVLNFVQSFLVPGTVIIFDDWHAFDGIADGPSNYGEQKAWFEWSFFDHFVPFPGVPGVRSEAFIYKPYSNPSRQKWN